MSEKANQIKPLRARMLMHAHTPRGWKVVMGRNPYQRGASGLCDFAARTIHVPYVCDDYSLGVFFHEAAHARLHRNDTRPNHLIEFEAEREAHAYMRECGFVVTRFILRAGKEYVSACIIEDEGKGLPIDPTAKRWVGKTHHCRW